MKHKDTQVGEKTKTEYQKKMDNILTPEVIEEWKKNREIRFQKIVSLIEDEDDLFLEKLNEWISNYLDECYSNYD